MVVRRQLLDTVAANLFALLMLGARWNLDGDVTVESLDDHVGAEDCRADI